MSISQPNKISIEEFYKLRENSENLLEYIDGIVYMTPSPSTQHQRVSGRLHAKLFNFRKGKSSKYFMPLLILKCVGLKIEQIR